MNKKTVGIITLQNSNNYGAMYQVYALSKYIENLGYEVFILDYEMTRDNSSLLEHIKSPVAFLQKLYYKKALLLKKFHTSEGENFTNDRSPHFVDIFQKFRTEYLTITDKEYDYNKLTKESPPAYAYICGSDQVWAADFFFTSPAFLLGFVPKSIKKIAYAPSFGKNKIEQYLEKTFTKHIKQFDSISVREKSGVNIVKDLTNRDATHVLDPTLLLDKSGYSEIIDYSLVPKEPYIFVYKLHQEKELSDWMTESIDTISKKEGINILAVSTNCQWSFPADWKEMYPTPGQLLGLIERSQLTLTNSFHGTVFSIILQTKFLSFARDRFENKQNVRMTELLESLSLEDFYCAHFLGFEEILNKIVLDYNYKSVNETLDELKMISSNFLKGALD